MSVPFFTIVTPVYNGEKYISKTIDTSSLINKKCHKYITKNIDKYSHLIKDVSN